LNYNFQFTIFTFYYMINFKFKKRLNGKINLEVQL